MKSLRTAVAVAALALALAACGSSAPPTARALARKIPGCIVATGTPAVIETGDATCTMANGATIEIGTFAGTADERKWISAGGTPSDPDPQFAGCCVQGDGWAATVDSPGILIPVYRLVIKALGGRMVNA